MAIRNAAHALVMLALALVVAAATPATKWEPTLAFFEFLGSWEDPTGKLIDWEEMREVPDPPAEAKSPTPTEGKPLTWETLPEAAKPPLEPFRADWEKLDPHPRDLAHRGARHWSGLDAQQRTMLFARYDRWSLEPKKEQANLLARFAWWNRATLDERRAAMAALGARRDAEPKAPAETKVRSRKERGREGAGQFANERRSWFEGLPAERQTEMRSIFKSMSRDDRRNLRKKLRGMSAEERKQYMRESFGKPAAGTGP